jgi:hypothetical protein
MEILVPILVGWIGYVISGHVGNLLFAVIVKKLLPVTQEKDGRFVIIDGTDGEIKIYELMRTILHYSSMVSHVALGYIFITPLRGPFSLLFWPALVKVFVMITLILSAKFSRRLFGLLVGYKNSN